MPASARLWPEGPRFEDSPEAPLTTDSVLLADFARTEGCRRGVDLGCGSGVLMLLLMWGSPALSMSGLELSEVSADCAARNLERNGLAARAEILCGDLREKAASFPAGSFPIPALC